MVTGTILAVFLVPVFFVVVMSIVSKVTHKTAGMKAAHSIHEDHPEEEKA
jgi:hypothetical protein